MNQLTLVFIVACVAGSLSRAVGVAPAPVVLLSNLGEASRQSSPSLHQQQWLAAPIATGSQPAQLSSVSILFGSRLYSPQGMVWVAVYEDSAGLPDAPLQNGLLSGPSVPAAYSVETYANMLPVSLDANTRYWIVAASDEPASGGIGYSVQESTTHGFNSDFGWALPPYFAFSADQGTSWRSTETAIIPAPLMVEVSGSIIPEPATFTLLGLGSLALVMVRRRDAF